MTKPAWKSRTMWVNAVAAVASLSVAMGLDLGMTTDVQASIVTGIMAVVNIGLRLVTTQGIGHE